MTAENAFDSLLPRAPRVPEGDKQLTAIIPERVFHQLKVQSASKGDTLRVTVLKALQKAGYNVTADDMIDRRVPAGRARSTALLRNRFRHDNKKEDND